MIPKSNRVYCILVVLLGGIIVGCQSEASYLYGSNFGDIWRTYQACRSTEKIEELITHVQTVEDMTLSNSRSISSRNFRPISHRTLTSFVEPLKPRLAADPLAMHADCLLHAGQTAYRQGHIILAQDMFSRLLKGPQNPELRYYVQVARFGLLRINEDLQATAEQPPPTSLTN
jgi:hypothetical protein